MNQQEHSLVIFQEELIEVSIELQNLAKMVSKTLRFGPDETRLNYPTNVERLKAEWADLLGSMVNLQKHGIELSVDLDAVYNKLAKIDEYTGYAEKLGTVKDG